MDEPQRLLGKIDVHPLGATLVNSNRHPLIMPQQHLHKITNSDDHGCHTTVNGSVSQEMSMSLEAVLSLM